MEEILQKIYDQHDIVCNQKYGEGLPYSFHLKCVVEQVKKYENLRELYKNPAYSSTITLEQVIIAAAGHDLIEDARLTYNDVLKITGENCAEIIYACTEEKGKNRSERHSDKFLEELAENRLAVYVKLCDIMTNILYSLLTNSSMFKKYRYEYHKLKAFLYIKDEYDVIWDDLATILSL